MKSFIYNLNTVLLISSLVFLNTVRADELSTDEQKLSYTVGIQVGNSLKQGGMTLNTDALTLGIKDALSGSPSRLNAEDMQNVMSRFREKELEQRLEVGQQNLKAGKAYLEENKSKEGVKETESGLQYKILKEGTGKKPSTSDTVEVHYKGHLIDDDEPFDSSYKRGKPATFPLNGVIKGWQEALVLMSEGSKYQITIPSELAYGERGAPPKIGPNATLVFDIELISVK